MTCRLAVFDCDGTLVDSQANIVHAMEDCFGKHRMEAPRRDAVRRIVGLSLTEAMCRLVPDAEADLHVRLADDYKLAFQALRSNGGLASEPLYPGVREGLLRLERAGWMLGVATGKSDRGLALTLTHHGIHGRFVTLQTADRHPSKPHPSMLNAAMAESGAAPATTLMVGDTVFDMEMARAAEVGGLGVSWGYHDAEELGVAGAVAVFDDFAALTTHMMETLA